MTIPETDALMGSLPKLKWEDVQIGDNLLLANDSWIASYVIYVTHTSIHEFRGNCVHTETKERTDHVRVGTFFPNDYGWNLTDLARRGKLTMAMTEALLPFIELAQQ